MGSNMKKSIFEEQTAKALKKWHQAAKQRKKKRPKNALSNDASFMSAETTPSQATSPLHLLHNHNRRSSAPPPESDSLPLSPMSYVSDAELSELEGSSWGKPREMSTLDRNNVLLTNKDSHKIDFSFDKSPEH